MADLSESAKKYGGVAVEPDTGPTDLAASAAKYGGQDIAAEGLPLPRRQYGLGEAIIEAPFNAPSDVYKQLTGLKEAVTNPVETIRGLFKAAAGATALAAPEYTKAIMNVLGTDPATLKEATDAAKAVGGDYANKYGSWEAIKRTLAEQPVTGLSDLSLLFSGVGGVAKLGAKTTAALPSVSAPLTKTASAFQTGALYTNPFSAIAPTVELGGKMVGAGTNYLARVSSPKFSALTDAAEGRGQEIINALRNYDEYVAGGMPTAGVAATPAGSTRYAALQQEVANRQAMTTPYYERDIANKAARERALGTIAQDEAALQRAENVRQAATKPLYGKADKQIIVADDTLNTLLDRPSMEKALARAKQLAAERNETFQIGKNVPEQKVGSAIVDTEGRPLDTKTVPAEYAKFNGKSLHYLKLAMDDLIKDPKTFGLGSNEISAIKNTRGEFLKWFEGKSANYAAAREAYTEASKPINIMQVGQYLEGKLKPAIETPVAETAGRFSQALKEAPTTLKQSTGQSRFQQLSEILTPDQVKIVEGIRKDLAREAEFASQAKAGTKGGKAVPAAELSKAPGFFSKIVTVTNTIIDKLQGKINEKVALELATEMLDPKLAADVLEKALARQAKGERLADPFVRAGKGASRMMRGDTGLGLRSPLTLGGVQVSNALAAENQNNLNRR
jgi:hypothetical protein